MTANQKEENLSGCSVQIENCDDGIDTDIENLERYICDNICRHNEKNISHFEREYRFCSSCEVRKHTSKIKAEYGKINSFDQSEARKLIQKYRKITLCKECVQRQRLKSGRSICRIYGTLGGFLEEDEGCSRGEEWE